MVFVLICTEGEVSEPSYIRALGGVISGQAPITLTTNVEVLPIPLRGNHGHVKLVQKAEDVIASYRQDSQSLLSVADEGDMTEKWLVVDYDNMDGHGINIETLRQEAQAVGYTLVVNKPNFEVFILAHFMELADIMSVNQTNYIQLINEHIDRLNSKNEVEKGFTKDMFMPPYSKKLHIANKLFGLLLNHHPELINRMINLGMDTNASHYTEMPIIMKRIKHIYAAAA